MTVYSVNGHVDDHYVLTNNGVDYVYDYVYAKTSSVTVTKESVDTESFVPGNYRVNPYKVSKDSFVSTVGKFSTVWDETAVRSHSITTKGDIFFYPLSTQKAFFPTLDVANISDRAIQRAYAKLANPDLAMGEQIGELKETCQMLINPLSSLRKFLFKDNHLNLYKFKKLVEFSRTGKWKGALSAKQATKAASATWLEIRYGFRPLVMSVQDVIEYVNRVDKAGFSPTTIRSVHARNSTSTDKTLEEMLFSASTLITGYGSLLWTVEATAFASVQYRQLRPNSLAEDLGLTAPYLPETAWELTRLSFVWDWLISIGPWIQSMRVKPHIEILGNTLGVKKVSTLTIDAKGRYYKEPVDVRKPIEGTGVYQKEEYERVVDYDLPSLPLLTGGDIIDLFRSIDAVTLILQRMLK